MRESDKFKRGEALPHSKLTEDLVREIRSKHSRKGCLKRELDAKFSAAALAADHGVSVS